MRRNERERTAFMDRREITWKLGTELLHVDPPFFPSCFTHYTKSPYLVHKFIYFRKKNPTKKNYLVDLLYEETTFWTEIRLSK